MEDLEPFEVDMIRPEDLSRLLKHTNGLVALSLQLRQCKHGQHEDLVQFGAILRQGATALRYLEIKADYKQPDETALADSRYLGANHVIGPLRGHLTHLEQLRCPINLLALWETRRGYCDLSAILPASMRWLWVESMQADKRGYTLHAVDNLRLDASEEMPNLEWVMLQDDRGFSSVSEKYPDYRGVDLEDWLSTECDERHTLYQKRSSAGLEEGEFPQGWKIEPMPVSAASLEGI